SRSACSAPRGAWTTTHSSSARSRASRRAASRAACPSAVSMNPATITSVLLPLPAVDLSAFGALWHAGRWWADVGVRSSSRGGVVSRVLDPCGSGSVFEHGVQQYGQGVIGDGLQGTVEQNIGPGAVRT